MPEYLVKLNLQNIHRLLAYVVYGVIAILVIKSKGWKLSDIAKNGVNTLFLLVNVQFVLGVFTLIYQVPLFTWRVTSIWSSFIVALNCLFDESNK